MILNIASTFELTEVIDFYWTLIDRMNNESGTVAWKKDIYPTKEMIKNSVIKEEMYIFKKDNRIIASVILNGEPNDGYKDIPWSIDCLKEEILIPHLLAVDKDYQGEGLGKLIVKDIIELAKRNNKKTIRLDILDGNIAAEKLYLRTGFKYVSSKEMYYEDTGWKTFSMFEMLL